MKRGNGGELPSRSFLSRVYKTRNKTDRHRSICELDVLFFFKKEGERGVVKHSFSFFFSFSKKRQEEGEKTKRFERMILFPSILSLSLSLFFLHNECRPLFSPFSPILFLV